MAKQLNDKIEFRYGLYNLQTKSYDVGATVECTYKPRYLQQLGAQKSRMPWKKQTKYEIHKLAIHMTMEMKL